MLESKQIGEEKGILWNPKQSNIITDAIFRKMLILTFCIARDSIIYYWRVLLTFKTSAY